jgi:hypothetical protein
MAASFVISQTGTDALLSQLTAGLLTPDEYRHAVALVEPLREEGKRCLYCSSSAVIGETCAGHANLESIMNAARATRPLVDMARCGTRERLTNAVMTALELAGLVNSAAHFAERAEKATGMNALCMIAREYVRLESSL